ncbi:MAG TPA: OsmC family protein [Egibacteraceae bacterium]|nr:OsmC family protein [Egibacteraceae bacterium]
MQRNGIDVDLLRGTSDEFRDDPDTAAITIRTTHRWGGGFAVDGSTDEIEAGGERTRREFTFRTDWPPEIGGRDSGPSPGEAILGALGGCVAMTYIMNATLRGIEVSELEITITGQVDLSGAFQLDDVRAGLSRVTVKVGVRSDAADDVLDDLGKTTERTSAVYETLANPVPMRLEVTRIP